MEVHVTEINGLASAICTMYLSKRHLDWATETEIRNTVNGMLDGRGRVDPYLAYNNRQLFDKYAKDFNEYINSLVKIGTKHTTLFKYIDFACSVYGLHRGAQDDFDSHAERLDSRIVRSSTRLAKYEPGEKSSFYKDKIMSTDEALDILGIKVPDHFVHNGSVYVKTTNGYVQELHADNKDVLRGLYMLSIPSDFIFKCNITQFAHIVAMRDKNSSAAPELREMIEMIISQLSSYTNGIITRDLLYKIEMWEPHNN